MARPKKEGLDYFPHDTDAHADDKIQSLMALYGSDGYCFYFIMLEKIFRTENGRITVGTQIEKAGLSRAMSMKVARFDEILKTALELKCFDTELYLKENVISSNGIAKRIQSVAILRNKDRERKNKDKSKDKYKRKGKAKTGKTLGIHTENPEVTETKQKFLRHVYLTDAENSSLLGKLNSKKDEYIERLDGYIAQIGVQAATKKYKSHYDVILNWHRKDIKEGKISTEHNRFDNLNDKNYMEGVGPDGKF